MLLNPCKNCLVASAGGAIDVHLVKILIKISLTLIGRKLQIECLKSGISEDAMDVMNSTRDLHFTSHTDKTKAWQ